METKVIRQGLRDIRPEEAAHIQKVVKLFPGLSRHELAQTLCEHLSWYSPSGAPKVRNCLTLLDRLHDQGFVALPAKSARGRLTPDKPPAFTHRTTERVQYKIVHRLSR